MVDEVLCLGQPLGVGESSRGVIPLVHVISINASNFDKENPRVRPTGWAEARAKRVMVKEQVERGKGVSEEEIRKHHETRLNQVRGSGVLVFLCIPPTFASVLFV